MYCSSVGKLLELSGMRVPYDFLVNINWEERKQFFLVSFQLG